MHYGRLTQEIQFRLRKECDTTIRHFPAGTLVGIQKLHKNQQEVVARGLHVVEDPEWVLPALSEHQYRVMSPLELLAEAAE